ncbi:Endoribonuclease HigB [Methylobacterium adhaesivum]|uniref:Type II toxin-antitoxin system RelE/ParE family toxin n=1 Tax=Methylobacterium adhaesivum TaxID=333297 RepID=A0ABT8BCJ8_9HYPH|nr:type II toxin-antitoxin system RelE/ParE family toxin [Methylobacterium adhaesivum]MDN3589773.1 type II toxin-antitoxin system RelE/ParE family toxin [Methylobacterium adhaesivum]GJD28832.1 Endoribonuclease HigB [Methylobacterium adhaesivum]
MKIRNVRHKGLRRFLEADDSSGLPAAVVPKIRIILAFLLAMMDEEELRTLPVWKPHQLTGNRAGTWTLHVTKNWRITFAVDHDEIEIIDLDYEDYH